MRVTTGPIATPETFGADGSATSAPEAVRVEPAPPAGRGPSPRSRRVIVAMVFIGIVALAIGGILLLSMTRETPAWWRPATFTDTQSYIAAQNLENGVATLLTSARPPNEGGDPTKPWTVGLRSAEANAWLNTRLQKWLENQNGVKFRWPSELEELRVEFNDQRIYVGARIRSAGQEQILTAVLAPEFRPDGSLWLPAEVVTLGRLALPAKWVLGTRGGRPVGGAVTNVPESIAELPQTRVVLSAFAGENAVMLEPTIRLGDGRRVRVLGLTAKDGRLLITCQTVIRETAGR